MKPIFALLALFSLSVPSFAHAENLSPRPVPVPAPISSQYVRIDIPANEWASARETWNYTGIFGDQVGKLVKRVTVVAAAAPGQVGYLAGAVSGAAMFAYQVPFDTLYEFTMYDSDAGSLPVRAEDPLTLQLGGVYVQHITIWLE